MKHHLIIDTGKHFLPPASSLWLLVSDEDLNNLWIMIGWQICYTRPNMMAHAGLYEVGSPSAAPPSPTPPRLSITQHLGAMATAGTGDGVRTTSTHYGSLLPKPSPGRHWSAFYTRTCCFLPSLPAPGRHCTPNSKVTSPLEACKEWGSPTA